MLVRFLAFSLTATFCAQAHAATMVVVPVAADATISIHPYLGAGTLPQGKGETLWVIEPAGYTSSTLLYFDLGDQKWSEVSDAVLRLTTKGLWYSDSLEFSVSALTGGTWNEASVSWNNFSWMAGSSIAIGVVAAEDAVTGATMDISLPPSLVSEWAAFPERNFGLIIEARSGRDLAFFSREAPLLPDGVSGAPVLIVSTVPESSQYQMASAGGLLLSGVVRKRKAQRPQ